MRALKRSVLGVGLALLFAIGMMGCSGGGDDGKSDDDGGGDAPTTQSDG